MVFLFAFRPMMVMQVTLLPQPDSPTIASVLPFSTVNETPSTAWTMPSSVRKYVFRSLTSSSGMREIVPGRGQYGRAPDQASLIRGSITAYRRSIIRLKRITMIDAKITVPAMIGRSKLNTDWIAQ